jgi:hypothetical protein
MFHLDYYQTSLPHNLESILMNNDLVFIKHISGTIRPIQLLARTKTDPHDVSVRSFVSYEDPHNTSLVTRLKEGSCIPKLKTLVIIEPFGNVMTTYIVTPTEPSWTRTIVLREGVKGVHIIPKGVKIVAVGDYERYKSEDASYVIGVRHDNSPNDCVLRVTFSILVDMEPTVILFVTKC